MGRITRLVGVVLVGLSALAVVQTAREIVLWELGNRAYAEEYSQERPFTFAGHTFTVADDQLVDSIHSQAEFVLRHLDLSPNVR